MLDLIVFPMRSGSATLYAPDEHETGRPERNRTLVNSRDPFTLPCSSFGARFGPGSESIPPPE